jgi:hypothetical protein
MKSIADRCSRRGYLYRNTGGEVAIRNLNYGGYYNTLFSADVDELPGCCGIGVVYRFYDGGSDFVYDVKNWDLINGAIDDLMRSSMYSSFIATHIQDNVFTAILEAGGWELTRTFRNKNTHNVLGVYQKSLRN